MQWCYVVPFIALTRLNWLNIILTTPGFHKTSTSYPQRLSVFQLGGERELESFWKMTIEYLKWCMYVYVYAHSTLLFSGSDMLCRYTTLIIHALIQVS